MSRERLLADFLELIQIPSVSGSEEAVRQVLLHKLAALGLDVEEDAAGNLLARFPGDPGRPASAFSAHLDTVPTQPVRYQLEGDWVSTRGDSILAADDRAGIAALLEAVRQVQEGSASHGTVEMLFTVEEETGLVGSRAFDLGQLHAPFVLVLDHGGPPASVVRGAPSLEVMKFHFQGQAAHAGSEPEQGVSAVRAMALAITRMPLGRIDEETTANIGLVSGGSANNVIPERAEMSGEARSHDRSKLAKQVQAMLEAAEGAAREIGTRLSVEHEREFDGYFLLDGHPLLLMLEGMAARCGLEYKPITAGGASDANVFNARGLPAAVLCCGYYAPHTTREKLAIPQMEDLARWVRAIMERS